MGVPVVPVIMVVDVLVISPRVIILNVYVRVSMSMRPVRLPIHRIQPLVLPVQMVFVLVPMTVIVMLDIMDQDLIALGTQLVHPVLVKMVVLVNQAESPTRIVVFVLLDTIIMI